VEDAPAVLVVRAWLVAPQPYDAQVSLRGVRVAPVVVLGMALSVVGWNTRRCRDWRWWQQFARTLPVVAVHSIAVPNSCTVAMYAGTVATDCTFAGLAGCRCGVTPEIETKSMRILPFQRVRSFVRCNGDGLLCADRSMLVCA